MNMHIFIQHVFGRHFCDSENPQIILNVR